MIRFAANVETVNSFECIEEPPKIAPGAPSDGKSLPLSNTAI